MKMEEVWAVVNEKKNADFLFYLWQRWQDEREYEDIADYLEAIKGFAPGAYKAMKRPFGFKAHCDDGEIEVSVKRAGGYVKIFGKMMERRAA